MQCNFIRMHDLLCASIIANDQYKYNRIFRLVSFDFDVDIACVCLDLAFAARRRVRHLNSARVRFGGNDLFGQKRPFDGARIGFHKDLRCIARIKAHVARASFNGEFFSGDHVFKPHVTRVARGFQTLTDHVCQTGIPGGHPQIHGADLCILYGNIARTCFHEKTLRTAAEAYVTRRDL